MRKGSRIANDPTHARNNAPESGLLRRTRPRYQARVCGTSGSKLGIGATKKLHGECFKRPWLPLIKIDVEIKKKIDAIVHETR